jgi:hypothetical protein
LDEEQLRSLTELLLDGSTTDGSLLLLLRSSRGRPWAPGVDTPLGDR